MPQRTRAQRRNMPPAQRRPMGAQGAVFAEAGVAFGGQCSSSSRACSKGSDRWTECQRDGSSSPAAARRWMSARRSSTDHENGQSATGSASWNARRPVAGLDASDGLLRVARSRLPEADLRQGDLEAPPWESHSFDAVTAFNAVQYAADPISALREIRRVAVSGAPVAVASWGDPERCDARVLIAAMGGLLPPPPPGAGGPFALAAPGALEALVESAGLAAQRALEVATPFVYADLATAVRASLSSGPARVAIEQAGAAPVGETATDALRQFLQADGSVRLENVMRFVICHA